MSEPGADALLILEDRAASLGVIYSILSLIHIKLAPDLLLLLYLFIYSLSSFPSSGREGSGSPSGEGITTWAGQSSEGCKEQPLPLLMPPLPLHQGWDVLLLPKPWDGAFFLLFLVES